MAEAEEKLRLLREQVKTIALSCPRCGATRARAPRGTYDPPEAVRLVVPCPECSVGCKVDGGDYYDSDGLLIDVEPR